MIRQPLTLPELSEVFRDLCAKSPYTMKQVLEDAGIPQQYPSKWAKGQGRPLYHYEVVRLANKLNQPVEVFLFKDSTEDFVHVPRAEYEDHVHIPKEKLNTWIMDLAESVTNSQDVFDAFRSNLTKYINSPS